MSTNIRFEFGIYQVEKTELLFFSWQKSGFGASSMEIPESVESIIV